MEFWNVLCAVISVLQDTNDSNPKEAISLGIASLFIFSGLLCFLVQFLINIEDEDSLGSDLDGWIFNIKNMGRYKTRPKLADKEPFKRLFELSEVANLTVAEYRNYSRSLKRYWDSCAVEDTDNWRYERGKEYGIIEGKIEGKVDSAMQMFSKGFDRQTVIDVLELVGDEVRIFDERIKNSES